ncbi:MAG: tetratricopeptide repeat protein, partial [Candidatus Korobacteraceae bacterium]
KVAPPSPAATPEQLESQGDVLRQDKLFLDAQDYYEEALGRIPSKIAMLHNKLGITKLQTGNLDDAKKSFEMAIKSDKTFAEAHNNLGVLYYMQKKYGNAVKEYEKAIDLRPKTASFYNNLASAHFGRKDYEKAAVAYQQALEIDPGILDRRSNSGGYSAQLPSPEDRATYSFVLAKLFSKNGDMDRALQHLRMAIEDGYKDVGKVFEESDFEPLRNDPRFAELMAARPAAIQ